MHERRYNINSILGFEEARVSGGNGRSGQCEFLCRRAVNRQHDNNTKMLKCRHGRAVSASE